MMKKLRQNGFVLVLVITAIGVIGAWMFVLCGMSNTILFQSDIAYLEVVERNLVASGLAWASRNIKSQSKETFDKTVELDVTDMNIRRSTLAVIIAMPGAEQAEVQIDTSCGRGRCTLSHSDKYHIQFNK
ncbi:MAG: hypothetical protein ACYS6W_08785 [Planctomycetota bacterium]|jgi:hypothetical protein